MPQMTLPRKSPDDVFDVVASYREKQKFLSRLKDGVRHHRPRDFVRTARDAELFTDASIPFLRSVVALAGLLLLLQVTAVDSPQVLSRILLPIQGGYAFWSLALWLTSSNGSTRVGNDSRWVYWADVVVYAV